MTQSPRWKQRPSGSNWGDFGPDDQIGRMNLLTPERRLRATRCVEEGRAFALSLPLDCPGGSVISPMRHPPKLAATVRPSGEASYHHCFSCTDPTVVDVVSDDSVTLCTQYSTQWDALSHWGQQFDADADGHAEVVYYNGFRAGIELHGPSPGGGPYASRLGIDSLAVSGVQGRGVLVDLAALYGDTPAKVGYDALMRALEHQRIEVEPGDFLCLHTGWADLLLGMDRRPNLARLQQSCAALDGSDARLLQWISASGVVALCADNLGVECLDETPRAPGTRSSKHPLHEHCLFKLGVFLGEMWFLSELAQHLRQSNRAYFLLTAPPLRLPGAVGSPVTPVATV